MPGQVHAVVKQTQDIDALIFGLTEQHKVTPTSALASNVQGADAGLDVVSRFGTQLLWARHARPRWPGLASQRKSRLGAHQSFQASR